MARWLAYNRTDDDLVAHLLKLRGFSEEDLNDEFSPIFDPFLLPDMDRAVELIIQAKKENWHVAIFGDYDADGTPGAALMSIVLDHLKIPHQTIIPTREQGYGLKKESIDSLGDETKLLITIDNGVKAVDEIAYAKKKGMKVIVLDHHLPGDVLPSADALVDQHLPNSKYPFLGLCGCALAYKLTTALEQKEPSLNPNLSKWLLDIVAISTVADMMPIISENRPLVKYGLKVLKKSRWPGVKALLSTAKVDLEKINEVTLGYIVGPRLNATGRMGDNQPALDLLLSRDPTEAAEIAWKIERSNQERQQLVEKLTKEIEKVVFKQNKPEDPFIVVYGPDWPLGVIGLVAGRLAGTYYRPAIVLSQDGETLTGSGRSIPGYSLVDGLKSQEKLLTRFGGHKAAAGLALEEKNLEKFIAGLKKHAASVLTKEDLEKTFYADAIINPEELSKTTIKKFSKLSPFGIGNPSPKFVLKDVEITARRTMGKNNEHLKLNARHGDKDFEVVLFGADKKLPTDLDRLDLLGSLDLNTWKDKEVIQLKLTDCKAPDSEVEMRDFNGSTIAELLD